MNLPRFPRRPSPAVLLVLAAAAATAAVGADYPIQPVPFTAVRLTGGFWHDKQEVNRRVTVPFALQQCEESGRLRNFDLAAEVLRRRAAGEKGFQINPPTIYPFDDTDAYKAIEGAAYVLQLAPDPGLERQLEGWIARIAAAQEPDGYLYTFRTMHPDSPGHKWVGAQRWELDPELSHELYNLGHLYEAGVAHFQATGRRSLLDICLRSAELLWHDFGDGRRRLAPGHPIVEMGLVRLYRATGDRRWLDLAKIFLEARGPGGPAYNQRHRRVVDQDEAVGHAVRANYLYSGMADIAVLTGDARYRTAIDRLWDNVVGRKLYLTGGVGALDDGEAYGADYQLPADGYNETCAALALMMWAHRMFLSTGDARYMDVFERTAYNGFISGVSDSGDRFFYTNPLVYDGSAKINSGFAGRAPWFGCACCPPNLMRTLASLGGYFYAVRDDAIYVNVYGSGTADVALAGGTVKLTQTTAYPWDGRIRLQVSLPAARRFTLRLRLPGWAQGRPVPSDLYTYDAPAAPAWAVTVAGAAVAVQPEQGYLPVTREWRDGDTVELTLPLAVRRVKAHPKVEAAVGRVALERGPIVYCIEPTAGPADVTLSSRAEVATEAPAGAAGPVVLTFPDAGGRRIQAIPYYAWNNHGLRPMEVWLRRAE